MRPPDPPRSAQPMEPVPPHRSLERGELLNWYRIERILGRGGFGVTYLARDTNLDCDVAIKQYAPGAAVPPEFRVAGVEKFIAEARAQVRFRHPSIVRVMSVFRDGGTAYLVMEYEEGESLREHLARDPGRREQAVLLALVRPVVEGLAEVHRHGFVHRDVKPANILVRPDGTPVLIDFGSARELGSADAVDGPTALVSAGYAPLEQYATAGGEDSRQGPWTDLYALAGVLYHAVSGSDPVDSTRRAAALIDGGRDPLLPAAIVGEGRYERAFLEAIDAGLAVRVDARPRSLPQWLAALSSGDPPPSADGATGAPMQSAPDVPTLPSTRTLAGALVPPPDPAPALASLPSREPPSPSRARRLVGIGVALATIVGVASWFAAERSVPDASSGEGAPVADGAPVSNPGEARVPTDEPAKADAEEGVAGTPARRSAADSERSEERESVDEARPSAPVNVVENADPEGIAESARRENVSREEARSNEVRREAARLETERREAARREAARQEATRQEAERLEATRQEEARREEARREAARHEEARQEAVRQEAARQKEARQEAAWLESARREEAVREAERDRLAEERRVAEAARRAEAARVAQAARQAEERRAADAARREAAQAAAQVAARVAEEARAVEARRPSGPSTEPTDGGQDGALAADRRAVSDEEVAAVATRFEALRRALGEKDAQTMDGLTQISDQNRLFRDLIARYAELDVVLSDIRVRSVDRKIVATLEIRTMLRENGDRATPSEAYRSRPIVSERRADGSWTPIIW